jgi:hypothetical protein
LWGCWSECDKRAKREKKNWGLFRVGFLTLNKKTCLRRHQYNRSRCNNATHSKESSGCVSECLPAVSAQGQG